mmetsp:Transcript_13032/g.19269  ORF Transcript_13032/g.19269 Transcript_13032/m.19269 type:complete len:887 (+) Transcript_13032:635-3295(+)
MQNRRRTAVPPQDNNSNHIKSSNIFTTRKGAITPPIPEMERRMELLEHRLVGPASNSNRGSGSHQGSHHGSNHGSHHGSNHGSIHSFGFRSGAVEEKVDNHVTAPQPSSPSPLLTSLSSPSVSASMSHLSNGSVGGTHTATGSNQTLITSHAMKLPRSTVVAESPPVPMPEFGIGATPVVPTGVAKRLRLSVGASPAIGSNRNDGPTPGRKKSLPTKRALPSITEKHISSPGRTGTVAGATTPALRNMRKRGRLHFSTPIQPAHDANTSHNGNAVLAQHYHQEQAQASLPPSELSSSSRDRSGSASDAVTAPATPIMTPAPKRGVTKHHPPPNNSSIRDFFGKKTPDPETPPAGRRSLSVLTDSSSLEKNGTKELERLRIQCQQLEKLVHDRDEQLKAVANNQTIMHHSLKVALTRREAEMEQLKQESEQRTVTAQKCLEEMIRADCAREAKELREKLASDGARLGRLVYTRAGLHTVESWEDGHASKALKRRRVELKQKREELEERQRVARRAVKRIEMGEGMEQAEETTAGGLPVTNSLDAMEAEESVRWHLANLRQQEVELGEEEVALQAEKSAHVRALKRVASEDLSRFKARPKLHDRYILLTLLGKGGFSEVWRAYDLIDLREVAVKIHQLDPQWSESKKDNYTKHVSREYEIHREVRHPRIVSLFDVFEIDTNSFATVLECCKGTDLDSLLKQRKMLPERDARAILLQILCGMRYLSSPSVDGTRQGIIHYDLKPGNILFDSYGDAKITDFGLSKIVDGGDPADSMELTSQGAGTYWYLPPECFMTHQNVRISNKVDVWSIGVIYYQMLFGKRPFGDGQTQEKVLTHHIMLNAREVRFPPKPLVSEEGKQFIRQMLTYDQAFRPNISQLCDSPYLLKKKL